MGSFLALCILLFLPMGCYSQACRSATPNPSVREDSRPGTIVTTLIIDEGHTADSDVRQFGVIGTNLVLAEEVDYEEQTIIVVTLICKKGSQTVLGETIFVQIINVNDNEPIFKETSYSFQILESLPVNSTFGSPIQAEDADGDTLYYELIAEDRDTADYFRLSSITYPLLVVNKTLDYDLHPHVRMNLTARDTELPGDNPSFTATTLIIIDIGDADDKPPFFQPCRVIGKKVCISDGYSTSVIRSEAITQPLQLIPGPLYAIDGDYGINDPIAYSIISGNGDNIFAIGVGNGNITMNKPVDSLGTILLQVMAYQTNDELKYSTTTVQIDVKEKNDFPPRFEKSNYPGTIPLNMATRSFVRDSSDQTRQLHVFAIDEDFPDGFNPAVTYIIENSNDFIILRDGYILTNAVFTSPRTAVFAVTATDSTSSESTSTTVTVEITNTLTTTTTTGPANSQTTTSITPGTGTTTIKTPSTGTTTSTTRGTGTITTTTPSTGTTTSTTRGTGTTTTTTPSTGTTTSTTRGTGTTTTTTPSTGTTTSTTRGTGTTTTTTPSTGTTTSTTRGTGTTTTTTLSIGTTTSTTRGTGTTTTTTPNTQTTTSTTPGTGTTTTTTPNTRTTTSTTPGTGTTTTTTPNTRTTMSTTPGTGTTKTTTPNTRTTTSTTPGTGTTTTTTPNTRTTPSTTPGTGTTTTTSPNTQTTTSTTPGTGTTTTTTPNTQTTQPAITGTGITATTGKGTGTRSPTTGNGITAASGPSSTKNPTPGNKGEALDKYYTTTDMAILGATLGVVVAACLAGLAFLIYKQYGNTIRSKLQRGTGSNSGDSAGTTKQLINDAEYGGDMSASNPEFGIDVGITAVSSGDNLLSAAAVSTVLTTSAPTESPALEEADGESDSEDKKVKSILTKDLKEDGGYKSVWFREDAAPEVMVIEGVEHGEANDDYAEEELNNQQEDNDDDEDDEDELDPTFTTPNNDSNNSSIL
ncbi:cadherin-related family member 5 isoform 2-T2 [Anomaloglossus baeobatrachus]|uniref:cadherin-related family member 5 isoform X2 n=1 Tax=Anomaloglossus baeobatrachus TaxID=238106 RepID=UPI003F508FE3